MSNETKNKEFLDTCNVFIYDGKMVVLCRQFGAFDWPKTLNYENSEWGFKEQDAMDTNEGRSAYGGKAIYIKVPGKYKDVTPETLFEKLINQYGKENIVVISNLDGNPEVVTMVQVNQNHYIITHNNPKYMPTELTAYMLEVWLRKGFLSIYGKLA